MDEGSKMWDSNDHIAAATTEASSSEGMMSGSSVKRNVASSRASGIALQAEKSVDKLHRKKRFRCSRLCTPVWTGTHRLSKGYRES